MDFNIGNLVSAAVGAVTKVANAVIDFFSPAGEAAEAGGMLGGLAGVAVDVAEAVLGAVSGVADVNGDGEIDAEEAEKIVNDVLKVMLGGMIVGFGSVSLGSNSESDEEDLDVGKEGEEIWIPPTLYDYDKDSEKYSISSQNLLVDLSQQWFDAKTSEDKKKIERQLLYFRTNIPSDDIIDRKFQEGINEVLAGAVGQLALYPAEMSEAQLNGRINNLNESEGNYIYDALSDGDDTVIAGTTRRLECVGRTPSKTSRTGREVIARMMDEGKIECVKGKVMFEAGDGEWYELKYGDMAHKEDAVKWWNENGRKYGEKAPEVRKWMLESDNYYIEHRSINRSEGAKIGETYKPSLKPPIVP